MTSQCVQHVEYELTFKKECIIYIYMDTYYIPQNVNHGYFSGRIMDSFYFLICDYLSILYIV